MHKIRFRLGRRPRPRWGNAVRSPAPPHSPAGFKAAYFYEKEGREGRARGWRREGRGPTSNARREGGGEKGGGEVASWR